MATAVELCCGVLCRAVLCCAVPCRITGGRNITSRIKVEMHAFWNALIWLADTILFIWMGVMLAFVLLEPSDPSVRILGEEFTGLLTPIDAAYAVLLYVWLMVSSQTPRH
jgi:NhaP-type Na+/H+ or K+/H+ antiporter